ncbi:MAG: 30S ribosomal protein S20, partial [Lentisphaerae bacterium]|nr:30S ribosomal protein S20 [Lentisphaerota bacterium]
MPNIKSAMKRMRTSEKACVRNRSVKTRITSARRDVMEAFVATDKEKAVGN